MKSLRCLADIQNDTFVISITQQIHGTYISVIAFLKSPLTNWLKQEREVICSKNMAKFKSRGDYSQDFIQTFSNVTNLLSRGERFSLTNIH